MDGGRRTPLAQLGGPAISPRLGGPPPISSNTTGYPWVDGDVLYAADLNAAIGSAAETVNLRGFGAASDGVTDDSAALNAAIAAILSLPTGGKLIIPAGRTVIGSAITASIPSGVALTIEGMGATASELYFSNATNGLNFTLLNSGLAWGVVCLRAFTLTRGPTSPATANTGVTLQADSSVAKNYDGRCILRDLRIHGSTPGTNQWQSSVVLSGLSAVVDSVQIVGANAGSTDLGDAAVTVSGVNGTHFATSVVFSNCGVRGCSAGLVVGSWTQGVFVSNCSIIGQYDSIRCTNAGGSEDIQIVNCTMAAGHRCILMTNWNFNNIANNTPEKFSPATPSVGYAGIEIVSGGFTSVIGNGVTGTNSGTEHGIIINGCGVCTVGSNTTANIAGAGIWLTGNTGTTNVIANAVQGGTACVLVDPGPHVNFIWGNSWEGQEFVNSAFNIGAPNGTPCVIGFQNTDSATPTRWFVGTDGASETGGNAGSNYHVVAYDDTQVALGTAFTITRATRQVIFPGLATSTTYANDTAAATGGVPVGGLYRNGSILMVRVT